MFLVDVLGISGGLNVVLEHAQYLQKCGDDVYLSPRTRSVGDTDWHQALQSVVLISRDDAVTQKWDMVIATFWVTALDAWRFNAEYYVYFVQSIESRFFDDYQSQLIDLVNATYSLDWYFVTEASWIKLYLESKYNRPVWLARNGMNKVNYRRSNACITNKTGPLRILIEGPIEIDFKGVAEAIAVASLYPACEVWLLTSSNVDSLKYVDRVFSRVSVDRVAGIMSDCDVLIKLSRIEGMFGPPLEMFHCGGTAITYDIDGADEYIIDGFNAITAQVGDLRAVANNLEALCNSPTLLARLKVGALETASKWPDWNTAGAIFRACLGEIARCPPSSSRVSNAEICRNLRSESWSKAFSQKPKPTLSSYKSRFNKKVMSKLPLAAQRKFKLSQFDRKIEAIRQILISR